MADIVLGIDPAVIVKGHVQWALLTPAAQVDLQANYPCHPAATIPAAGVTGDAVDPRFEQWLDGAYLLRHANDNIGDDPTL